MKIFITIKSSKKNKIDLNKQSELELEIHSNITVSNIVKYIANIYIYIQKTEQK
jgi:hypothetical protein